MTYGNTPPPAPAVKPPRRNRNVLLVVLVGVLFLLLCVGGVLAAALSVGPVAVDTPASEAPRFVEPVARESSGSAPAPTKSKAQPAPAPSIDGNDVVHVGEDVPAGTYRVSESVTPDGPFDVCYWAKSRDAEGNDIIDNGLPTGGRPQVTLKKGQWFTSQGCPVWRKK